MGVVGFVGFVFFVCFVLFVLFKVPMGAPQYCRSSFGSVSGRLHRKKKLGGCWLLVKRCLFGFRQWKVMR